MATLFDYSPAENAAGRIQGRLSHRQRLAAVLGDGREWEHTGEVLEVTNGTCACGHQGLRFMFELKHPKRRTPVYVGSSCIECYSEANPALVASIQASLNSKLAEAAERRKAAKELADLAEVAAMLRAASDLAYQLDAILAGATVEYSYKHYDGTPAIGYKATRRVSGEIYYHWHTADKAAARLAARPADGAYPFRWKQYKSKAAFKKVIQAQIDQLQRLLAGPIWSPIQ